MLQLASIKDCGSLGKYVEEIKLAHSKQYVHNELFYSPLVLRGMIFSSQLIVLYDGDGKTVDKLFSVFIPSPRSNNLSLVVAAFYDDSKFVTESLAYIKDLLSDDKYTKIKFVIDGENIAEDTQRTLVDCGFQKEVEINTSCWNQFTYSYYFCN